MTLPSSGQITMGDINVELGRSRSAQLDLNDSSARLLAGVASGQIKISDFWGKSWIVPGSRTFSPGNVSFPVPRYTTLTIETWAGGGGGAGGSTNDGFQYGYNGFNGGAGGGSSYVGTSADAGGGGAWNNPGGNWENSGGASGGAGSGSGNVTVVPGGGGGGGVGYPYSGGAGGYAKTIYTFGVTPGYPAWGAAVFMNVGSGGGGGRGGSDVGGNGPAGGGGGDGQAVVSWS